MVGGLSKAKSADVFLFEEQTFEESPNFFVAGPSAEPTRSKCRTRTRSRATTRGASRS